MHRSFLLISDFFTAELLKTGSNLKLRHGALNPSVVLGDTDQLSYKTKNAQCLT